MFGVGKKIFFHSVDCLFVQLMAFFALQKFFSLVRIGISLTLLLALEALFLYWVALSNLERRGFFLVLLYLVLPCLAPGGLIFSKEETEGELIWLNREVVWDWEEQREEKNMVRLYCMREEFIFNF